MSEKHQAHADGFQAGWHAALRRVIGGDEPEELAASVPDTYGNYLVRQIDKVEQLRSQLEASERRRAEVEQALRKVRAHTSYTAPVQDLLVGLLASIERIADAALAPSPEAPTGEDPTRG